ncbi:MAG: T9SS type A sorting domain-containing protein [Saprospiraceae bacterium]|nr:T9SS type A sorting domain-containing protein [Saprospiraceae bacterium]
MITNRDKYSNSVLTISFCIMFSLAACFLNGQANTWNKIQTTHQNNLNITCVDSKGNFYVSNLNVNRIAKVNIYTGKVDLLAKPTLGNQQIQGVSLFTGFNEELYVLINGDAHTYQNNQYNPVLLPNGKNGSVGDPRLTYLNALGDMFTVEFNHCYRYDTNWNLNSTTKIYYSGNAKLYAPSFYIPDTNFILQTEGSQIEIINLNTRNGACDTVLQFNAPINEGKFAILERDGRFYIPTAQDLYYYKNFGKELFVPLIDVFTGNGYIKALTKGKVNQELVIYKGNKFYISYDDCQTWLNPEALNKNFPDGRIKEIVVWDSLHAIVVVTDICYYDHLYYLDATNKSWKSFFKEEINNLDMTEFGVYENGDFSTLINVCTWAVSSDKGSQWNLITPLTVKNSSPNYNDFIHTEVGDFAFLRDTLYSTIDYGKTWVSVSKLPNRTKAIDYLGDGKFLITSDTLFGRPYQKYHISYDYGRTFNFKYFDLTEKLSDFQFTVDHNQNILNYQGSSGYYISTDDGASWNPDLRFGKKLIWQLAFSKDGEYFMTTKINNKYSLYSTRDFVNYKDLTEGLRPYFKITFDLISDDQLFIATYDYNDIFHLYYSPDRGHSLQSIDYDIGQKRSEDRTALVNNFHLDKNNELYMVLANDGLYRLSGTISTKNTFNTLSIQLLPNPATDLLRLSTTADLSSHTVKIINLFGQNMETTILQNNTISTYHLTPGIYFLQLLQGKKIVWSGKFVKM